MNDRGRAATVNKRQQAAVERIARESEAMTDARAALGKHERARVAAMRRADKLGVPRGVIADAAGVSAGRVSQILGADGGDDAEENRVTPSCVSDPATLPLIHHPAVRVSGVASVRSRRHYGRDTAFLPMAAVGDLVAAVGDAADVRVYLTGAVPGDGGAAAVRTWALDARLPDGWQVADRGHYLADADLPVLRFAHADGRRVTVMRAAAWFGEGDYTPADAAEAWHRVELALTREKCFGGGARLADTPATAGRALWLRTIPEGREYPVMDAGLRELIAATSGQGRIELRPPAAEKVPGFAYVDGRLMYGALTWGMPVGEPRHHHVRKDASAMPAGVLRGRGRWLVSGRVPEGWGHVGLFMVPAADGGAWCYPSRPREAFATWADGCEIWHALQHGWDVFVHEGITWDEGKPLNTWRDALVRIYEAAQARGDVVGRLGANAVRAMLITALGAFASRAHPTTGSVPVDRPDLIPGEADPATITRAGDALVYQLPGRLSSWSESMAHPEWSACVWARARVRLAAAALAFPPEEVIGLSTDALYLGLTPDRLAATGRLDGPMPDHGKPGGWRVKGYAPGPHAWPVDRPALYRLRDLADGNV